MLVMHIPSSFKVSDQGELFSFINQYSFGQLISIDDDRPCSTHIPFLLDSENKKLICHLAKINTQWKSIHDQEVLITFLGPHDYISPTWYVGNGVPTWDYQAVHVYGKATVINDHEILKNMVDELSSKYESKKPDPWLGEYADEMLSAIIGIEIDIKEIQGQYKLSQNRSKEDREQVIKTLKKNGSKQLSRAIKKYI